MMKVPKLFQKILTKEFERAALESDKQKLVNFVYRVTFVTAVLGGSVMYFYDMNSYLSLFLLALVSIFGWLLNRAGYVNHSAVLLVTILLMVIQFNVFSGYGIHDVAIIAWPAFIFFTGLLFSSRAIPYFTGLVMLLAVTTRFVPNAQLFSDYSDTGDLIVLLLILLAFSLIAQSILRSNQQSAQRLQQAQERFRAIYHSINDAILIHDPQTGVILDINEKMSEMFGYTRSEVLQLGNVLLISSGIPPYTQENALAWIKKTATQGAQHFEWQSKDKSGRLFWVDINMKLATIANQPQVLVSVRDITERKQVEDALEESREKYHGLSEASFEAIFISEKGICLEQNQMAEQMFGYSDSEAIGRSGTEWILPEDRETVLNNMLSGNGQPYEVTALRKDGSTFPAIIHGKMMHYKGRTVRVTSMSDITARKQAEAALQESENMLRRAQEIAHIGHFKFNLTSSLIEGSDELFRIFGLTREQFYFSDFANSVHPDDRASDLAFIESAIARKINYEREHRLLLPDGTFKWICILGAFPSVLSKEPDLIVGTVQDITERKRAELQREVLYQVHQAVSSQLDTDLVLHSAAETIVRLTGYPHVCIALAHADGEHWTVRAAAGSLAAELGVKYPIHQGVIGRAFKTGQAQLVRDILDDPDYVRDVSAADAPALRSELVAPLRRGEHLLGALNVESERVDVFNEADAKMIQSVADMIALALENARLYAEAQQEIAVRNQAEEALLASHQLLEGTFASLRDAVFIIDANTSTITDCNPAAAEIFGYSREAMLGRTTEFLHIDLAALGEFRKQLFPAMAEQGFLFLPEFKMKRMDGTIFPTEHTVMPLEGEQRQRIGWVSVVRDITESKQAEAALRESEKRLKEAQRIALIGNWELDLDHNNALAGTGASPLTWSDEIYRIFEIDPAQFGASYAAFLEAIHPADREMVDRAYTTSLETKSPYEIDHRLLMPDGRVKYVLERCESFYAADGHPLRSVGTVQDITERKRAEEALLSLKRSIDQSFSGIARADMHETIVFANKAWAKMHGYEVDEIIGKPLSIFHTQAQMISDVNPFNQHVIENGAYATEIGHVRKDGTTFITWMETTLVKDGQQQPIELIASAVDISERKRAEQALRENEEKYRRLFDNASLGIFQASMAGQVLSINPAFAHMLGYDSPADAMNNIQNVATDLFADPKRRAEIIRLMAETPDLRTFESVYRRKDGSTFIGQLNVTPVRDAEGRLLRTEGMVEDITERKQAEAKILAALEEKETLLREVHHRVKNNLQAMIALMEMQAGLIPDEANRQFLKELEGQARTMALVYEQLYQSVNLARVQMAPYLQQLTYYISETFGGRRMAQLSLDVGSIELDVAQAMPCGLIVNELYTNIFKHAFPPGFQGQPQVQIALRLEDDTYHLTVADNGVGLPPGYDWQASRSLGLRLVNLWATHQLGGTLNVSGDLGATYSITFPNPQGLLRETAGGSA
ncbi:MAG: PAS domain S-box protein [Chloroflexi bacterium]|nr:PAS domain S-box protein [Chloroflexota bacterium]